VTAGQVYFIRAGAYGDSTGTYQLTLTIDSANSVSPFWTRLDHAAEAVPDTEGRRALLYGEVTIGAQYSALDGFNVGLNVMVDIADMAGRGTDAADGYANVYVSLPFSALGTSVSLLDAVELSTPGVGYDFGIVFAESIDRNDNLDVRVEPEVDYLSASAGPFSVTVLAVSPGSVSGLHNFDVEPSITPGTIHADAYAARGSIPIWQGEVRRDVVDQAFAASRTMANPTASFLGAIFRTSDLSSLATTIASTRELPASRPFTPDS
jgi:hypothetical protein